MHKQIYLSIEKLNPDQFPTVINVGETFLGVVFSHGFAEDGKETFFAFSRVKRSDGSVILIENYDRARGGCPYPPPCAHFNVV